MERVLGFGGFFFRAKDPETLSAWYKTNLGTTAPSGSPPETPWLQEAGPTVFEPFSMTTDYFSADKAFMFNFRVRDLEAMLRQLNEAGIESTPIADYPYGRFSRIHDPEGNAIELWQPTGAAAS